VLFRFADEKGCMSAWVMVEWKAHMRLSLPLRAPNQVQLLPRGSSRVVYQLFTHDHGVCHCNGSSSSIIENIEWEQTNEGIDSE